MNRSKEGVGLGMQHSLQMHGLWILRNATVFTLSSLCRQNVERGVNSGMVRTVVDCQAGVDALKESYRQISLAGKSEGIIKEWFASGYLNHSYLSKLAAGVNNQWSENHQGKNVTVSIIEALKGGVGQPLLDLINYLDVNHKSHCLPNDLASGLSNLPVDFVYINGAPDKNQPTNKTLPFGGTLNGTESYKLILSYFTTTDISPDEILAEGERQLKFFYNEVSLARYSQLVGYATLNAERSSDSCRYIST